MQSPRRIITAALFALLMLPLAASAQSAAPKLTAGTWTGAILTPGNDVPTDLTYEVEYNADALAITMVINDEIHFALNEIDVTDEKLSFTFTAEERKALCVLSLKKNGYEGVCNVEDGSVVPLTMSPPAKARN